MSWVASATSWPIVRSGVVSGVVVIGALTSGFIPICLICLLVRSSVPPALPITRGHSG